MHASQLFPGMHEDQTCGSCLGPSDIATPYRVQGSSSECSPLPGRHTLTSRSKGETGSCLITLAITAVSSRKDLARRCCHCRYYTRTVITCTTTTITTTTATITAANTFQATKESESNTCYTSLKGRFWRPISLLPGTPPTAPIPPLARLKALSLSPINSLPDSVHT
ncbi:hypothetical protein E2C01_072311 [Portunus trituberculatus]|uniref:Uncharacterized protein n=1 Tax=Portunus trituberculatus TaxID=210409 RepID=A0A5B7I6D4_PORTR|nr:hypothetical protein [Portunus trituberculatus]